MKQKWPGRLILFGIFLAGLLMLFAELSRIFMRKEGDGDLSILSSSYYHLEKNTLDVLCIGSSHAFTSFQPNVLWHEQGITSYVIGGPSQTFVTSYYMLKDALQYQKPKVVLLEGYYFRTYHAFASEERLHASIDGMRLGKVKKERLDDELSDYSLKDRLEFYFPFLLYHSRWNELQTKDFYAKEWNKGSNINFEIDPQRDPGLDVEEADIPEMALDYFERIRTLCAENGIALAVYFSPFSDLDGEEREWYEETQGRNRKAEGYLRDRGIPLYYCQREMEDLDFEHDFEDYEHPNVWGAEKVTKYLGNRLASDFGLKGHKKEASFASWDRDYEEYRNYVELHSKE